MKVGSVEPLTDHINQIDKTGNIKFTYEKESDSSIPFLDTLIVKKQDGSIKLLVYRKKTHTDQYLHFTSHHPIQHKLSVIRTLMDRKDKVVTEQEDKDMEEQKIKEALKLCGYPEWTFKQSKQKKDSKTKSKKKPETNTRRMVVLPYKKGLSQRVQRIFKKHGISTSFKPHKTLRNILVHPKDKREVTQTAECVYEIPCLNCEKSYIGETGRLLDTRIQEHKTESEKASGKAFTRSQKASVSGEINKSAITDHVAEENHVIGWKDAKIIDREQNKTKRLIKEAIWIRRSGRKNLNRDDGNYFLSNIYDQLFTSPPTSSGNTKSSTGNTKSSDGNTRTSSGIGSKVNLRM